MDKIILITLLLLCNLVTSEQIGKSVAHDSHIDAKNNKFLQREAHNDDGSLTRPLDEFADGFCPQDIAIRWHTEIPSSIYATPLITDLFSDGRKDIIIPGFRDNLLVVDGQTGAIDTTFEAFHRSNLHTTPLLYDIDFDGVLDIVVASYDGEIQFYKDTGSEASYRISLPRLRIKRDWFKGLKDDPTDHSNPDISSGKDDSGVGERAAGVDVDDIVVRRRSLLQNTPSAATTTTTNTPGNANKGAANAKKGVTQPFEVTEEAAESFTELFGEEEEEEEEEEEGMESEDGDTDWIDEELAEQLDYSHYQNDYYHTENGDDINGDGDARHVDDVKHIKKGHRGKQERPHSHDGTTTYDDEADYEDIDINLPKFNKTDLWEDDNADIYNMNPDALRERRKNIDKKNKVGRENEGRRDVPLSTHVWIDPHILANPVIADIDNDGRDELVVAVSYFFDPGEYAANSARAEILVGKDGDPAKYVASGIVVYDLNTRAVKWSQHLDLSTRYTRYKALIYSHPTVADINNDGKLEVIVGTSMGFLYVLNADTGNTLDGWPIQMGDIQGQVAVADVDGDGKVEIIAADVRGSIVALTASGIELWERHLGSAIGAGVTLGDVDGNGKLEVVFGTFDGRIYVLDARSGADADGYPFRTYGRITTPILLTKLDSALSTTHTPDNKGLQMAVVSHDGFLYVIDGASACADTLDLGEPSYSMVLADDLAQSGHIDLLVATAGGALYSVRTGAKYQPLKTWPSQSPGIGSAGFVSRWNWQGIYATATSRIPRDVRGDAIPVRFTIVDNRPLPAGVETRGPYRVSVSLQGIGVKEMNAGDAPIIGMSQVVNKTGTFSMDVPCPRTRTSATIKLVMKDETGAVFTDEFALSFHIHFYRLLKWLVVGPFAFTVIAVLMFNGVHVLRSELPS